MKFKRFSSLTALLVVLLVCVQTSPAFSQSIEVSDFKKLVFNEETSNPTAVRIARKFMEQAYEEYDPQLETFGDIYAQYIELTRGAELKYIASYALNEYGECYAAGCKIYIYENYEGTKWRKILGVTAHEIFIRKEPGENLDYILVTTYFENPDNTPALWEYEQQQNVFSFKERL